MISKDMFQLARQAAEKQEDPKPSTRAPIELLEAPPFLHEREIHDALRVARLIASGRNPFSQEPFGKLRGEHRDSVLQALCVVAVSLAQGKDILALMPESKTLSGGASDPSSKRPLQEYLDRLERDAIREALEEAHYNGIAAARLLGISPRSIRYRMKRLELFRKIARPKPRPVEPTRNTAHK